MRPPRVLHLIDSAGVYGAERVILNLSCEQLVSCTTVPVVGCLVSRANTPNALHDAAMAAGIETMRIPASNARLLLDLPAMVCALRRADIDIIHAHGYKPAVFGFLIGAMTGIRVTSTCHLWFKPEQAPLKKRAMVALEKWLYRRFPKVLAVSEDIRRTLIDSGVSPERIEVIVNGVDVRHEPAPTAIRRQLRRSLGLEDSDFCVLNAARLTHQKAQEVLIDAAACLKRKGHRCVFLIVGSGELEATLRRRIEGQGVDDCVRLLGFRDDIKQLMTASDAFALPSLNEGMPMSLLEAVAAKLPVVATPVGDIPKIVKDGVSGLLVPVGEAQALATALERLRGDSGVARSFVESAYQRLIESYSCQAMAAKYQAVYQGLLSRQ